MRARMDTGDALYCVYVGDNDKTIWAVGNKGARWVSHDRGRNWQSRTFGGAAWANWLNAICFDRECRNGWIAGTHGILLETCDGGTTWHEYQVEGEPELVDVRPSDDGRWWALDGRGGLYVGQPRD